MDSPLSGKRVNIEQLVERRAKHWDHSREAKAVPEAVRRAGLGPYVAISRAIGTHGRTISERVAERLGWDYYEREIVEYIAKRAQVREHMVKSLGETEREETNNWVRSMIDGHAVAETAYFRHLVAVITGVAAHGNAVILGRGAQFILPPSAGLRVRLYAPKPWRIETAMVRYEMTRAEAEKLIRDSDRAQARFYKDRFHKDMLDPLSYDLLVNVSQMDIDGAAQSIVCALRGKLGPEVCPGKGP